VLPSPAALFDTSSGGMYSSSYLFTDLSTPSITVTAWNWDFGDGSNSTIQNPSHTFPGSGTYTVTEVAFNKFGCPDTFKITVSIGEGIIIPNVFTPDGDGINDVWYIPNSGMKEFSVEIFDRWGAKVFQTTADEIRWDGRSSSGQLLSDGTYFYNLKAVLKSGFGGKDYSTTGYVTLFTNK
jgi:gliding motility-associated-like protein